MRAAILHLVGVSVPLLASGVAAGRFNVRQHAHHLRAMVTDEVIVTAVVTVTEEPDGSFETGLPGLMGAFTTPLANVLPTTSSIAAPVVPTTSSSSVVVVPTSSVYVAPTTLVTSVAVAPTTLVTPVAVAPTTLVTPVAVAPTTLVTSVAVAPTTLVSSVASTTSVSTAANLVQAVASTVASTVASSAKRGFAYNDADLLPSFTTLSKISWCYNWGSSNTDQECPTGVDFYPMLWGPGDADAWTSAVSAAKTAGSTHLMFYNEPDNSGQSDVLAAQAAADWKTYMEPYADEFTLHGPAVTNGVASGSESPMGVAYLTAFTAACSDCTIHATSAHWYGTCDLATEGSGLLNLKQHISDIYTAGGNLPVYLTEYQCQDGTEAESALFIAAAALWLDSSSMVGGHSYFMAGNVAVTSDPMLFNTGLTSLNLLGAAWMV